MHAAGLDGQRTVILGDIVVPEERLSRDDVHVQRVQVTHVLGQVGDRVMGDLCVPADAQRAR